MLVYSRRFISNEQGAVTVDWVVLTAAVAGLCIALIVELSNDATSLSVLTQQYLATQEPGTAVGGPAQD